MLKNLIPCKGAKNKIINFGFMPNFDLKKKLLNFAHKIDKSPGKNLESKKISWLYGGKLLKIG